VEAACCAGREIVVFGGQALERATAGRIKALQHRVSHRAGQGARFVFLFEQKSFPSPAPPPPPGAPAAPTGGRRTGAGARGVCNE
jgi:isopenicillin N synthase-like dioxygenase